ncbi:MAG: hypothetical protein GTN69_03045 [Armatimonadetes bacterium]|nr:hypothetical protein [Armatimonadota bacterium]NIO74874.1 hypothetical protein [Armatimonadota bacterium]NIO95635.1 hypothetical protein [Armatimonadota bacterium]
MRTIRMLRLSLFLAVCWAVSSCTGTCAGDTTSTSLTPKKFISLLGGFPEKPPLAGKVLEIEEFPKYTRKLVEYTTEGEERIQAFLLVPRQIRDKVPGILAIHQDGGSRPYQFGKSEPAGVAGDPGLKYGLELCLRGYVVICPDRFPFESRSLANSRFKETFDDFPLFTRIQGKDFDLTENLYRGCVANRLLFKGRTYIGKELFELQRAVDYLCAQPEVDSKRIGVIGHFAGGFNAALLMYVDPRIKAGCASCGTFLIHSFFGGNSLRPMSGLSAVNVVPGLKKWGDVDDILAGLAPRPFLETRGDFAYISEEEQAGLAAKARARYAELGVPDRFEYVPYDGGHVFRKDMREKSYAWFDRWLEAE